MRFPRCGLSCIRDQVALPTDHSAKPYSLFPKVQNVLRCRARLMCNTSAWRFPCPCVTFVVVSTLTISSSWERFRVRQAGAGMRDAKVQKYHL